jgi:hypothetical protein
LWWFSKLETALERGDRKAAREALRNLARLGVEVRFTLPPCPSEETSGAASAAEASAEGVSERTRRRSPGRGS